MNLVPRLDDELRLIIFMFMANSVSVFEYCSALCGLANLRLASGLMVFRRCAV